MKSKIGFKQRMLNFMQGRYGVDQLSNCLIWLGVILALLTLVLPNILLAVFSWTLLIYAYIRIFSKQINKRYAQNQKFLDKTWGIRNVFAKIKYRMKYGKQTAETHRIYKCSKCGQRIRVPKGKGKIQITCPKCQYKFIKKS